MTEYTVVISNSEDAALQRVAANSGKTARDLVQEQMIVLIGGVLKTYTEILSNMTDAQSRECVAAMAAAKADYEAAALAKPKEGMV